MPDHSELKRADAGPSGSHRHGERDAPENSTVRQIHAAGAAERDAPSALLPTDAELFTIGASAELPAGLLTENASNPVQVLPRRSPVIAFPFRECARINLQRRCESLLREAVSFSMSSEGSTDARWLRPWVVR